MIKALAIIFLLALPAFAATVNWTNTAGLNSTPYHAGDTVVFWGTITNSLTITNSGTSGNPITFQFAQDAVFSKPVFAAEGAIQFSGARSNIVIDGGVNGKIENTANGMGLTYTNNSRGIGGTGNGTAELYNTVIKNLTVTNMYRKVKNPAWPSTSPTGYDTTRAGYCIDIGGSSITVSNCALSDADAAMGYSLLSGTHSNVFILANKILDYNHGMFIGTALSNCTLTNIHIASNYLDHSDTWDTQGNTDIHLDAIIFANDSYSDSIIIRGMHVNNNTIGGYIGFNGTTAGLYNGISSPQMQVRDFYMYNNLCLAYAGHSWGNGFLNGFASNCWVFNNTFIGTITNSQGYGGPLYVGGKNVFCYNNIMKSGSAFVLRAYTDDAVTNSSTGVNTEYLLTKYFTNIWSDYNIIVGGSGFSLQVGKLTEGVNSWLSGDLGVLSEWQTWYNNNRSMTVPIWNTSHADPNSKTNEPVFNAGTYVPSASDTAAKGSGTNLTTVLTALGVPTADKAGNSRPTTGAWTIGAFEYAPTENPGVTNFAMISIGFEKSGF